LIRPIKAFLPYTVLSFLVCVNAWGVLYAQSGFSVDTSVVKTPYDTLSSDKKTDTNSTGLPLLSTDSLSGDKALSPVDSAFHALLNTPEADSLTLCKMDSVFAAFSSFFSGFFGISGSLELKLEQIIREKADPYLITAGVESVSDIAVYPFRHNRMVSVNPNENYFLLRSSVVDFSQTLTVLPGYKLETVYDSATGCYIFEETFGINLGKRKNRLRESIVISYEDYISYSMNNQARNLYSKAVVTALSTKEAEGQAGPLRLFTASVTTNETFQKIFGGDEVAVDARGNINMSMSVAKESSSRQSTSTGKTSQVIPKFEQKQQFNLRGTIGRKVEILIDQDSEREFEFENNIKIIYTGFDDEVLQKLEAGNIDLSLPGTEFVTAGGQNKGLFGIKALFRLGDFNFTTIASLQRGEKTKLTYKGGAGGGTTYTKNDYDYTKAKYFFLNDDYRENYQRYTNQIHTRIPDIITSIRVFRGADGNQSQSGNRYGDASYGNDFYSGYFLELKNDEYRIDKLTGILELQNPVPDGEAIAVWYQTESGQTYGTITSNASDTLHLVLIWDKNPSPDNSTWNLEMKNIYDFYINGLSADDVNTFKIKYKKSSNATVTSVPDRNNNTRNLLQILHLDERSVSGGSTDDRVDISDGLNYGLYLENGRVIFPRLRPFDPDNAPLDGFSPEAYPDVIDGDSVRLRNIYDRVRDNQNNNEIQANSKFTLEIVSTKRSATIPLGFNVLEGSEEIRLNGRLLTKDVDYVIDYFSGTITINDPEAILPSSDLEITYEQAQLFQIDKKTIFGARAEYGLAELGLGQNSFIGSTALFQSQSTINKRVQLGEEPFRNFVWDINTSLEFDAKYLTKAVNYIPLVSSVQPSKINIRAEYAKIFPSPNTSNGLMKHEENGVAYVDDFEAVKRTFPLGTSRKMWALASRPTGAIASARGRTIWFQKQEPRKNITKLKTTAGDQITVLGIAFQPDSAYGYTNSWGGIMRGFPASAKNDLSESRFIELWLNNKTHTNCIVNIDIGETNWDQNGDGRTNKEDPDPQTPITKSEDVGLDGWSDTQEDSLLTFLGIPRGLQELSNPRDRFIIDSLQILYPWGKINYSRSGPDDDPFGDNWRESHARPDDYSGSPISANKDIDAAIRKNDLSKIKLNGTEDNAGLSGKNIDGVRVGDTEVLDGSGTIDGKKENFFRYTFSTDTNSADSSLIVGYGDEGWLLYRIPINLPDTAIGNANLKNLFNTARVWITPSDNSGKVIALLFGEFQFVTSEWTFPSDYKDGIILAPNGKEPDPVEANKIVEITSVNTEESSRYTRPPGVKREYATGQSGADKRAVKEQSLSLKLNQLPAHSSAIIVKNITAADFRNYRKLKMFVHGDEDISSGIILPRNEDSTFYSPIRFFMRIGTNKNNYYEIDQPLFAGWAEKNFIEIDFDKLTALKIDAGVAADSNNIKTFYQPNNQVIRIKGNPSISSITQLYIGATNTEPLRSYSGEIWVDEMRLTDANDKPGQAASAALSFNMGDFLSFNTSVRFRTSEFRTVDQRFDANTGDTKSWSVAGNLNLHKFYIEKWGISLPLNMNYNFNQSDPKYLPNNDILVSVAKKKNEENISIIKDSIRITVDSLQYYRNFVFWDTVSISRKMRDSSRYDSLYNLANTFDARNRSVNTTYGFSLNFSKSKSEDNFWLLRYTIDNVSSNFNYTVSESKNAQYKMNQNRSWSSSTTYNLPIKKKSLKPLSWTPLSGTPVIGSLFKNIKETDWNYLLITAFTTDFSITSTESRNIEWSLSGSPIERPRQATLTSGRGYGLSLSPLQSLNSNISVKYQSDLRGLSTAEILKGVLKGFNPFDGFDDFTFNSSVDTIKNQRGNLKDTLIYNRDYSVMNSFNVNYSPPVFPFATQTLTYSSSHSSNRMRAPTSAYNITSQLSRNVRIDGNFSLKNFVTVLKESFSTGRAAGQQNRTEQDGRKGGRRERQKSLNTKEADQNTKEAKQDTVKNKGAGISFSKLASKMGNWGGKALQVINDTRFNLSFDNTYALNNIDRNAFSSYSWFGYATTKNSGFIENLFNFDLDTINQFRKDNLDSAKGLFTYMPRKAINYGFNYGFNFNLFTLDLKYDYSESRTLTNGIESRVITRSKLFPWLSSLPIPFFYDITVRFQNIARWPGLSVLSKITNNVNISSTYSKKETINIDELRNSPTYIDTFRSNNKTFKINSITIQETFPQISIDVSWKGNINQSFSYINTHALNRSPSKDLLTNNQTFTSNINYVKRGGFKLPLWFLKNKKINNEVRFATIFNLTNSSSFEINYNNGKKEKPKKTNERSSWSVEPRIDYSFTTRVTGGLFFKYESTDDMTTGKIIRFAGGFTVNITI